jgi:hypothetical protein
MTGQICEEVDTASLPVRPNVRAQRPLRGYFPTFPDLQAMDRADAGSPLAYATAVVVRHVLQLRMS